MKAILKDRQEITITDMFENYYENANEEESKRNITLNVSGETIDSLKEKLTAENLTSVEFVNEVETDMRVNLKLIMISKATKDDGSSVSARLAV